MKTILIALIAITMTACTSTRSLTATQETSIAGLEPGASITVETHDGEKRKGQFVELDNDELVYEARSGNEQRIALADIRELRFREYDGEKTGAVVGGTAAVAGAVLLGFVQVIGAFAQGM